MNIKEINFIKQVERTAKRDAYLTAAMYIKQFGHEYGLKIINEKADGHTAYLDSLPLAYDYATQSLVTKENAIDGELVVEAMSDLAASIVSETKTPAKGGEG